ncbi:MAG: sugar phosphate isomerase/epimerase [Nitratireductor sp.]|nr:sugar phosphate isomerase/epimerase [Nitratireductor sp.]
MLSLAPLTLLPCSPVEIIDAAAGAGFDAVGLRLFPVIDTDIDVMASPALLQSIKERLDETKLKVLDIEVVRVGPELDVPAMLPALQFASEVGARNILVTSLSREDYRENELHHTANKLNELAEVAGAYGLKPMLEFMIFRGVATIEDAVAMVEKAGHPNIGICVDALHLQRSGGNPSALAKVDPALFSCFQICDAPLLPQEDVRREARYGRVYPGEGELPLADILSALPAGIPVSVETPTESRKDVSLADRAREVARRTSEVLATAAPGGDRST